MLQLIHKVKLFAGHQSCIEIVYEIVSIVCFVENFATYQRVESEGMERWMTHDVLVTSSALLGKELERARRATWTCWGFKLTYEYEQDTQFYLARPLGDWGAAPLLFCATKEISVGRIAGRANKTKPAPAPLSSWSGYATVYKLLLPTYKQTSSDTNE